MEASPLLLFEKETETEEKQEREGEEEFFLTNAMNVWILMWFFNTINCFTPFLNKFCHQMYVLQTHEAICGF